MTAIKVKGTNKIEILEAKLLEKTTEAKTLKKTNTELMRKLSREIDLRICQGKDLVKVKQKNTQMGMSLQLHKAARKRQTEECRSLRQKNVRLENRCIRQGEELIEAKQKNTQIDNSLQLHKTARKRQTEECRSLRQKNARLESRCFRQEKEKKSGKKERVKNHTYSLEIMRLAIFLSVLKNISLRGVAATISEVMPMIGLQAKKISHNTIRSWTLRYGLACYESKLAAGRYVLLLDESISLGSNKLFLVLVVPLNENESRIASLKLEDVSVLELGVSNTWTGEKIAKTIEAALNRNVGVEIDYCVSDSGTNLKKALNLLNLPRINDCSHEIANCIESIFSTNTNLNKLISLTNRLRQQWTVGNKACYLPQKMRVKGRYQQIFTLIDWVENMRSIWDKMPEDVQAELFFLKENVVLLNTLKVIKELMVGLSKLIKSKGLTNTTPKEWDKIHQKTMETYKNDKTQLELIEAFKCRMDQYISRYRPELENRSQVICTSDIIESTFGKYKNKGGTQLITDDVLRILGFSQGITLDDIQAKLSRCRNVDLKNWKEENIPDSPLKVKRNLIRKNAS